MIRSHIDFQKITIQDRDIFQKYQLNQFPYSDFNLLSLLAWNRTGENSYAIQDGTLLLRIEDYVDDTFNFALTHFEKRETNLELFCNKLGTINIVPEPVISNFESIEINPAIDQFDYVINTTGLASLKGANYKKTRKKIHKFDKSYNNLYKIQMLDLQNNKDIYNILSLTKRWCEFKNFGNLEIGINIKKIENYIKYHHFFRTLNLGIFINNKLIGFTLNEIINEEWAMGHFGVFDREVAGISIFTEYYTSKYLSKKGYKFLNIQQDAGIKGLRDYKLSLRPYFFLKKYVAKLIDD